MQYLVYQRPYGVSARLLGRQMGLSVRRFLPTGAVAAVSWGAGRAPAKLNGRISTGKLHQLETWSSAGLSCLKFSTTPVQGWLARSGNSFGGGDFLSLPLESPSYWTKPIKSTAEYRVHLVRKAGHPIGTPSSYRVIRLGWKTNEDPSLNRVVEGVQIKSRKYGWKLKYYSQQNLQTNLSSDLDLLARWSIATIGWDFGALDVIRKGDRYYLVEANSAPGLKDEATCQAYATALREVIDGERV